MPPKPACGAVEDEPGPIQWRCSLPPHDGPDHAYAAFGTTYHEWTDRP